MQYCFANTCVFSGINFVGKTRLFRKRVWKLLHLRMPEPARLRSVKKERRDFFQIKRPILMHFSFSGSLSLTINRGTFTRAQTYLSVQDMHILYVLLCIRAFDSIIRKYPETASYRLMIIAALHAMRKIGINTNNRRNWTVKRLSAKNIPIRESHVFLWSVWWKCQIFRCAFRVT